jgi:hypothetical protein
MPRSLRRRPSRARSSGPHWSRPHPLDVVALVAYLAFEVWWWARVGLDPARDEDRLAMGIVFGALAYGALRFLSVVVLHSTASGWRGRLAFRGSRASSRTEAVLVAAPIGALAAGRLAITPLDAAFEFPAATALGSIAVLALLFEPFMMAIGAIVATAVVLGPAWTLAGLLPRRTTADGGWSRTTFLGAGTLTIGFALIAPAIWNVSSDAGSSRARAWGKVVQALTLQEGPERFAYGWMSLALTVLGVTLLARAGRGGANDESRRPGRGRRDS